MLNWRPGKKGMAFGSRTCPNSMTSPVRMSFAALSTCSGFIKFPEPRSSPAPHFEGQRWFSAGGVQDCAVAIHAANNSGTTKMVMNRIVLSPLGESSGCGFQQRPAPAAELLLPGRVYAGKLGTKCRRIGFVDRETPRERTAGFHIEFLLVAALQAYVLCNVPLDHSSDVVRQSFPCGQMGEHVESRPHVIGDRHVLHHFVVFEQVHVGQRILLSVHFA